MLWSTKLLLLSLVGERKDSLRLPVLLLVNKFLRVSDFGNLPPELILIMHDSFSNPLFFSLFVHLLSWWGYKTWPDIPIKTAKSPRPRMLTEIKHKNVCSYSKEYSLQSPFGQINSNQQTDLHFPWTVNLTAFCPIQEENEHMLFVSIFSTLYSQSNIRRGPTKLIISVSPGTVI